MSARRLLSLFGLKWNPFSPEVPAAACFATQAFETFAWRVENLAREGGFALVTGESGTGKSVALRLLAERLKKVPELAVGVLTRPQASVADFYRELGSIFGVPLAPHNRWAGSQVLRERWRAHIQSALMRAVLLADEAQEMRPAVLNELRLLSASDLDSSSLLTVVLSGDDRLVEKLGTPELIPLGSRIRARLVMKPATPDELLACLRHVTEQAGNPSLMTAELMTTLSQHAIGNLRVLMTIASELLDAAVQRDLKQLDEKLYLEVFSVPDAGRERKRRTATAASR